MTHDEYATLGTIMAGKMKVYDRASFERAMRDFPDGDVIITVAPGTKKALRSLQANKFMWAIFALIAEDTGHTKDEVHDWMCQLFLTYTIDVVDKQTGEVTSTQVTRGTSRLSTKEHAAFLDQVLLWGAEWLGLELPQREAA